MIGRAAMGNPWIFAEVNAYLNGVSYQRPSYQTIKEMILKHFEDLLILKGEKIACLEMRSHGPWYLKGLPHASQVRSLLTKVSTRTEFNQIVNDYFDYSKKHNESK
jgi:tRNA-dihydrouridine synthase